MRNTPPSQKHFRRTQGKGDAPRPTDREKYGQNYDEIFGSKRVTFSELLATASPVAQAFASNSREKDATAKIRQGIEDGELEFRQWVDLYERHVGFKLEVALLSISRAAFMAGRGSK